VLAKSNNIGKHDIILDSGTVDIVVSFIIKMFFKEIYSQSGQVEQGGQQPAEMWQSRAAEGF